MGSRKLKQSFICQQRVTGEGIEVTSLAWALDGMELGGRWRTFASLLDGSLCEVDWRTSSLAAATDSAGGVIWALATQPVGAIKLGGSDTRKN
jgi:hypothetical protein